MVPPFSAKTVKKVPESLISGAFSFLQNTICNKSATKNAANKAPVLSNRGLFLKNAMFFTA